MSDELSINEALKLGIAAHKAEQVQEANRLYTSIIKAQPKHPHANHNLGVLAVGVGKVQEALPFFKTALEASPNTEQFWQSYINALIKLERITDAKSVLSQAKERGVKGNGFDKIEQQLGRVETDPVIVSKIQDPPPNQIQPLIDLYNQKYFRPALENASKLLRTFPNSVVLYNISGAVHLEMGQTELALESFKTAIRIRPDYVKSYNNMGIALQKKGEFNEAIETYKKALAIKPDNSEVYNNMGNALQNQGEMERAVEAYKKALTIKPHYAEAYYNLGISLTETDELDEAIKAFKKALAIKPQYAEAYHSLGNSLKKNCELDGAIEAYNKALAIKPNYAEAFINLGNTLQKQARFEEAIEIYHKALAVKPGYAEAFINLGNTLQKQAKLGEAIEVYRKALVIKPGYAEAYYNLGTALQDHGKLEEALDAYKKALEFKPDYADAHNNIGTALQDQGEPEKALAAYKKALAINPDYVSARTNYAILLFESRKYKDAEKLFSMDDSNKNQTYLLKCFYEQDKKSKFYNQLDYLIERGQNNAVIGSFISRSEVLYGENRQNPFCSDPFKYVLKTDLTKNCDFKDIFVNGALKILSDDKVQHKAQGHLTNGIQTSGNIFTQVGSLTDQWQHIIHTEIEKYRDYFHLSEEGLIKNWPLDYSIYGWLVSMKSGGELAAHIHDTGWITGSIYINVPPKSKKDSGNLILTVDDTKQTNDETKNRKGIDVVTGSLCLFPSSLLHYTIPFESNENRIVLAFDMIPK